MRRPSWRAALAAAALLLPAAVPASGQGADNKPPSTEFLKGTHAFRRTLYDMEKDLYKVEPQPVGTLEEAAKDPEHTLLIVFGDPDRLRLIPHGLENFVGQGGALFLATDKPLPKDIDEAVQDLTGYTVAPSLLVCNDPKKCYRDFVWCPYLTPRPGAEPDLFRDLVPQAGGPSRVATNAPSYLEPAAWMADRWRLPLLARLPAGCVPERMDGRFRNEPLPFAVGGDVGKQGGRVLLLADHSIFINDMMIPTDNGNLDFSYNCLKWMTEGAGAGPRTRVLFMEDGHFNSRFDVPLKDMSDELAERILGLAGAFVEAAGRKAGPAVENRARDFELELPLWLKENGVSPFTALLVVLAVLVVLYGCWKVGWKARYRGDLQGPLLATALHRVAPAATITDQRRSAQLHGDNLWEPARDLARQFLTGTGAQAGAAPPPVAVSGGWLRRWTTAGRLRRLWRLAFGPPVRVRLRHWPRLVREVREMEAAFDAGTVQWR